MEFDQLFAQAIDEAAQTIGRARSGGSPWQRAVDMWVGFYKAVDWSENWLRILLLSHALLFVTVAVTRKNERVQIVLFCLCAAIVFAAERINNLGRERWETFAGQNYFDSRGLFITVVLSTPLLITALFILVNILLIMVAMMIEIARRRRETGVKKNQ